MTTPHSRTPSLALVISALVMGLLLFRPDGAAGATSVTNLSNIADGTYNIFDNDAGFGNRSGRDVANSFTTGAATLNLDSVTLFMANSAADNGGFSLALYSDAGALPGTDLGVTFSGLTNPGTSGLYSYTASTFVLSPSTTYWLVASVVHASPDKTYAWRTSSDLTQTGDAGWSIGTTALRNVNNGVPAAWTTDPSNAQIFSVQTVPEPISALLLAVGGAGLLVRRRR